MPVRVSDSTMAQIITSVTTLMTLVVTSVVAHVALRLKHRYEIESRKLDSYNKAQMAMASRVEAGTVRVARALAETTDATNRTLERIEKTADVSHIFLNSEKAVFLRKYMEASRRLADRTKDPGDVREAEIALLEFESHMRGQDRVDADAPNSGDPADPPPL